jgi:predicted dehydrogenase
MTKIKLGLIGSGGIAQSHLKLLPEFDDVELTAVCDIVKGRVEQTVQTYGGNAYTDYREMFEKERLDAVIVCVPPFAHADIEILAAQKGIHMLVEKPMGLDLDAVKRTAEAIDRSGVITATGYLLRYSEVVDRAIEMLRGRRVAMIRAQLLGGFVQTPWWRVYAKSGGQLVEQTTHSVDLIRYMCGEMRLVYANMALIGAEAFEGADAPSVTSMNFVMDSGAVGHLDTTYISPDWNNEIEIICPDYKVFVRHDQLRTVEKGQTVTYPISHGSMMKKQDRTFYDAVLSGDRSAIRSDYFDAVKTLEATLAANRSWETGQPVTLPM